MLDHSKRFRGIANPPNLNKQHATNQQGRSIGCSIPQCSSRFDPQNVLSVRGRSQLAEGAPCNRKGLATSENTTGEFFQQALKNSYGLTDKL